MSRPTALHIDTGALIHNLSVVRSVYNGKVLASVKANAYGHGLVATCQVLELAGIDYFGVALIEEGILLRSAGIKRPILVFGGIAPEQLADAIEADLDITVGSEILLRECDEAARSLGKSARIHIKVDTGMGRIGADKSVAPLLVEAAANAKNVTLAGIYSHFATADCDLEYAKEQLRTFQGVLQTVTAPIDSVLIHLANSPGCLALPEARLDMVRLGLLLYGISPIENELSLKLRPVASLLSRISFVKRVPSGTRVSYGCTWQSQRETTIATVPIGYGDGYLRALSNNASVLIGGQRFPVVGRVCMDQLMVDVGDYPAALGEVVMLLGAQGTERIRVEELARLADTTEHEITTAIQPRVPRVYL